MYVNVYSSTIHNSQKMETTPKSITLDEGIKNIWYIYTMESYSVIAKNEVVVHATTMRLENTVLNERSLTQKVAVLYFTSVLTQFKVMVKNSYFLFVGGLLSPP